MAPGTNIIALKVFPDGSGSASSNDIREALAWVVNNATTYNVVAVNMSLGYGDNLNTPTPSAYYSSELASLATKNVAVVVSSGNSYYQYQTQGVDSASADPNVWSIGAVWDRNAGSFSWANGAVDYSTAADQITSFSQRSETMTTVFAPGGQITGANYNGSTVTMSGTSQAAPHVAGLVADMLQKNSTLSFTQIRDFLKNSARPVGGQTLPNNDWGWGKLDVKGAVDAVPDPPGAPKVPAPPPSEPAVAVRFSTPPSPLLSLRDEFFSAPKGRFYNDLVTRHFTEVHALINTNRRVATVWHRNGGPALIRMGMQAAYQQEQPLPVEIEGVRLSDRLFRIADIIKRYGSEDLVRDIDEHVKDWITVVGEGFSVRQLLELFKEKEAPLPVMA